MKKLITLFLLSVIPVFATYRPQLQRITATGLAGTGTGSILVGTTENGTETFYPLFVIVSVRSANTITVPPTISIGTNSSSYNNLLAATALTGLTAVSNFMNISMGAASTAAVAANTGIYVNKTVGATATTMTFDVTIIGYYQ